MHESLKMIREIGGTVAPNEIGASRLPIQHVSCHRKPPDAARNIARRNWKSRRNLDAILPEQAVSDFTRFYRGEVLEWPNRADC